MVSHEAEDGREWRPITEPCRGIRGKKPSILLFKSGPCDDHRSCPRCLREGLLVVGEGKVFGKEFLAAVGAHLAYCLWPAVLCVDLHG